MDKVKILVVDDEKDAREAMLKSVRRKFNCVVEDAADGSEALSKLRAGNFDLMVLDLRMPGLSGIDVINETRKFSPGLKILVVSAYDSEEIAAEALKAGAIDYVHKPNTTAAIEVKIKEILTGMGKLSAA